MELPKNVSQVLSDPAYVRANPSAVEAALARLGCRGSDTFRMFFRRYAGPFSGASGFQLLDLVDQDENILTQTEAARSSHAFPSRYAVLSNYVGNSVLVYDCETDAVFDVDFEGSDQELVEGTLEPRWPSFVAFLADFFNSAAA